MRKKLSGNTIRGKLICYNMCIVAIIAILMSVISYIASTQNTIKVAKLSIAHHVDNTITQFDTAYEEMINIIINCTQRSSINISSIKKNDTVNARKTNLQIHNMLESFYSIPKYGDYITRIILYNINGTYLQVGNSQGSIDDIVNLKSTDWFHKEEKKNINHYELDIYKSPFYGKSKSYIMPMIQPMYDTAYKSRQGWVFLSISNKMYSKILENSDLEDECVVVTGGKKRIASIHEKEENKEENNNLIEKLINENKMSGKYTMKVHGEKSLVAFQKSKKSGIFVYEVLPIGKLNNDRQLLNRTIILIFIFCIVIGLVLSVFFTYQVQKPIDRLSRHIGKIAKGNFKPNPHIEAEDKIGQIGKVLNKMSVQMEDLLKFRIESEKEKKDLEIRMLQAQINPHFLYNTLDSIKWIAVIQKNSGIVKVVTALSCLLKNMAKGFNEKVTVEQELKFLNDYITIEKIKYVELFDVDIQIEEEKLKKAMIVKLTLQPLVENAIFSGIEPSGRNGTIKIHIYQEESNLIITVKDNGIGIPPEKLESILVEEDKGKKDTMNGIGLFNVNRRLKLVYGEAYGLMIHSKVREYTKVKITVPLEYKEF